jgi:hypothetical protein
VLNKMIKKASKKRYGAGLLEGSIPGGILALQYAMIHFFSLHVIN